MDNLPHDLALEGSVLGCAMFDVAAQTAAVEAMHPDDFYSPANSLVFRAVKRLSHQGKPADVLSVTATLREASALDSVGGMDYLMALCGAVYSTASVEHHIGILSGLSTRRRLIKAAMAVIAKAGDTNTDLSEVMSHAEQAVSGVGERVTRGNAERIGGVVVRVFDAVERRANGEETGRVSFGLTAVDNIAIGLGESELIILAARPGMGKTALAAGIAANVAGVQRKPVVVFTLEMSTEAIAQRMFAANSRVNGMAMQLGYLKDNDWSRMSTALGTMADWPLWIDDQAEVNTMQMRAKCRRVRQEAGDLGLIVIDYIGLMDSDGKSENRNQEVSKISRGLKLMAKEFKTPVLALCQLNRSLESRTNKRPMLSDLRDSGSIEQDADKVLFVYRDEQYNPDTKEPNTAEIIVSKHRNGPQGTAKVYYRKELANFEDLGFDTPGQVHSMGDAMNAESWKL